AGASPVLDDGLLAPDFRELLGDDAGNNVCRSSGGKRHNEAHDSIGPIQRLRLRPRGTTAKAEREGGPGGQSNQAAAREHDYLLGAFILSEREHLRIAADGNVSFQNDSDLFALPPIFGSGAKDAIPIPLRPMHLLRRRVAARAVVRARSRPPWQRSSQAGRSRRGPPPTDAALRRGGCCGRSPCGLRAATRAARTRPQRRY